MGIEPNPGDGDELRLCHRLDFYWRPRQLLLSYLRAAAQSFRREEIRGRLVCLADFLFGLLSFCNFCSSCLK